LGIVAAIQSTPVYVDGLATARNASAPVTARSSASRSRTSSRRKLTAGPYRCRSQASFRSLFARARLSNRTTFRPGSMKSAAALIPRKPAPPVVRSLRMATARVRDKCCLPVGNTLRYFRARHSEVTMCQSLRRRGVDIAMPWQLAVPEQQTERQRL
jgi:hypothetical protein